MRPGRIAALVAALLGFAVGPAWAEAAPVKTEHMEVELAPQTAAAIPGSSVYVALRHKVEKGWHTYWRNPGDAGQATRIQWTLPEGWRAGEIVWPTPQRYFIGSLMNYVYEGDVYLPVPIEVPADAKPGQTVKITAAASFLVCADVCVPEDATVSLDLPVAAASGLHPRFGEAVTKTLAAAPKPEGFRAAFALTDGKLRLGVTADALKGVDVSQAYFYPYEGGVLDHAEPQMAERGTGGVTLTLPIAGGYKAPDQLTGVLSLGDRAYVVEAAPGAIPAVAFGLTQAVVTGVADRGAAGAGMGLLLAVALAFAGGLILNLMPCVFPVLSMKAAALARHVGEPAKARAQGVAFLAGVVVTFLVLAGLLIAARAGGEAVGWGFHLQSPGVVVAMALLMFLIGLNLSGVFEVGLAAQGVGAAGPRSGVAGAFLTGALAVVVAAPCTAPFMAGAIGWAMIQPPGVTLAVFAALGLGLGAPFTALSFAPGLFRKLPRPGPWMEVLRRGLAFPMYGAAAWLAWVFAVQVGVQALPFLFAAAIAVAFATWAWGYGQRSASSGWSPRIAALTGAMIAIPLAAIGVNVGASAPPATASTRPAAAIPVEPWSPERVAALRAEGRPVFVDFTAAWCVTCQVNKRTALSSPRVAEAFRRTRAVFLEADWTNRNDTIARALAEHGRSGVPLYLVYGREGEPVILPQLLTEAAVVAALERAKAVG